MSIQILAGDCRVVLPTLPSGSVHCCVTSPPYWGLRDYGCDGQIGLESSPEEYVAELVSVFREVRRVLRDDGTVWLNLGDAYAGSWGAQGRRETASDDPYWHGSQIKNHPKRASQIGTIRQSGLKPKDLIGLPWMVAFALRADGWWLRQDNIWAKRNCMPESVRDRTTRAHEYVFQLTKSGDHTFWTHREHAGTRSQPDPDYRWVRADTKQELLAAPEGWPEVGNKVWRRINLWIGHDYFYDAVAIEEEGDVPAGTKAAKGSAERAGQSGVNARPPEYKVYTGKRNKRSVWHVATQPFAEAHFATMPPAIVETCILAGSSERGCCAACGAPWTRHVGDRAPAEGWSSGNKVRVPGADRIAGASRVGRGFPCKATISTTTGWYPSCSCGAGAPVPCTALDPFGGAGTTGLVADRLGRNAILIELNAEYREIAERRLADDGGMFLECAAQ